MKPITILVLFSLEAARIYRLRGLPGLKSDQELKEGYHWNLKDFDTRAEANAYREGLNEASGWNQIEVDEVPTAGGTLRTLFSEDVDEIAAAIWDAAKHAGAPIVINGKPVETTGILYEYNHHNGTEYNKRSYAKSKAIEMAKHLLTKHK